jgi:hypothetical protein
MSLRRSVSASLLLFFVLVVAGSRPGLAQSPAGGTPSAANVVEETNLETQLVLLVASNQEVSGATVPASLEPVVKRLRESLPFKNYRLAATLINRLKNDGRVNLKWIGGPLGSAGAVSDTSPSFNEFKINNVRIASDTNGQQIVHMEGFSFGVLIPVITSSTVAANGPIAPVINYEPTGLNTDISMREGEPVIVGTLNVGPSGDAIILVMTARRTQR